MKKRIVIACCVFAAAAALLLPPLAADTHFFLLGDFGSLTPLPARGWSLVLQDRRVRMFYLLYTAVVGLWLFWVLACGSYLKYRSDTRRVTPDIVTPRAAGQGQFGTARWMKREHMARHFTPWRISRRRAWFRALMAAGEASYQEVEDSNVRVD